jgi:hypothetical protein
MAIDEARSATEALIKILLCNAHIADGGGGLMMLITTKL